MKLFVDTAEVGEIRAALTRGISGVTTNPTLLSKQPGTPMETLRAIVAEIEWRQVPLSVELMTMTHDAQCDEARWLAAELQYKGLIYKVAMAWGGLEVLAQYPCNVTAIMSYAQAIVAANAGARYVSLFWGRISDIGGDAASVVRQVRETFDRDGCKAEIIVGSVRQVRDVAEAIQAGAHIVTVPPAILRQMCLHPQTDAIVAQFARDAGAHVGG